MGGKKIRNGRGKHQLRGIAKKRKLEKVVARSISDDVQPSCSTVLKINLKTNHQLKNQPHPSQTSASEKKLVKQNLDFSTFSGDAAPFLLIDSSLLCDFLNSHLTCKVCGSRCKKKGLFEESSRQTTYELNLRMVVLLF